MKTLKRRPRSGKLRPRVEALEARALMAGAGTLDPSFGLGRGFVIKQVGPAPTDEFTSLGVTGVFSLADGKVEVAIVKIETIGPPFTVISEASYTSYFMLARFNADGSPDATFGQGGQLTVPVPFNTTTSEFQFGGSIGNAVVMQPDGKILAAGTAPLSNLPPEIVQPPRSTYGVMRINVDGTVDKTYGNNGLATYPAGVQTAADPGLTGVTATVLQPNGQLVLGGGISNGPSDAGFAAVRLNADGSLDTRFGAGGTTVIPRLGQSTSLDNLAIQPGGGIVLAGTERDFDPFARSSPRHAVVRLDANGKVDTAFGGPSTGGVVILPLDPVNPIGTQSSGVVGLATQSDGKIVLATDEVSSNGGVPIADDLRRLNADGTTDTAFGQNGSVSPSVAGPVAIQSDGRIVVGGSNNAVLPPGGSAGRSVFAAARFNPDGSTDASFGNTSTPGLAQYNFGPSTVTAGVSALAIQPDGHIVLAGVTTSNYSPSTFTSPAFLGVARVLGRATTGPAALPPRPTAPASFDGSGRTNLAVYLPIFGAFAYRPTAGFSGDQYISFGIPGPGQTIPAAADYYGTGRTQIAAYLPSQGVYAIRPPVGPDVVIPFGIGGPGQSIPAPADYEGTGRADIAVYIPSQGAFGIRPSTGGPDKVIRFGIAGPGQSIPTPGDYEGTGHDDLAVYLPAYGAFAIRPATGGPDQIIPFGLPGLGKTIPAPGDYDGSGHTELAVYIPSQGVFAFRPARGGPDVIVPFGTPNDGSIPVPGDYSGSGHTEIALYDPNYGTFAYRPAGGGPDVITQFGSPGFGASLPVAAPPGVVATPPPRPPVAAPGGPSNITTPPFPPGPRGPMATALAGRVSKVSVLQSVLDPFGIKP